MYCSVFQRDPARNRTSVRSEWMLFHKRLKLASRFRRLSRERYGRRNAVGLTVAPIDRPVSGIAEPSRRFGERIEHWLEIESRAADDLQDVARRNLVFERFF